VHKTRSLFVVVAFSLFATTAAADTPFERQAQFVKAIDAMMIQLAPHSSRASLTIRKEYGAFLDELVLGELAALEDGLWTGGLVPLPGLAERFNLIPRTEGPASIAEKDLANQPTYVSARPATIGALLDVASRVTLGKVEVTSLVRHSDYQDQLRATNANANTSIPMHTMGLAFDIALVNTPLPQVYEIRDVLLKMQEAGDLLVIGERKQLVFHVVPHPSRLGHFTDVYARAAAAAYLNGAIAAAPVAADFSPHLRPVVETDIVDIGPTDEFADEWWAADDVASDVTVLVSAPSVGDDGWSIGRLATRCLALASDLLYSARAMLT
jgi:hypothetical protein